jgi:putative addiction module component (TIGR02574 family)
VSSAARDVRSAALALSPEQRAELAAELLASLDGEPDQEVEAAWAAEIESRVRRVRDEGTRGRDWETVRAEFRRGS